MDEPRLNTPCRKLAAFCRRYRIQKLAFFGSVLSDDFKPTSDAYVLVEFEKGYTPGLVFFAMPKELKKILGREVDLLTFQGVNASRNPIRCKANSSCCKNLLCREMSSVLHSRSNSDLQFNT